MNKPRTWKLVLIGQNAGLIYGPDEKLADHPEQYERVEVVELAYARELEDKLREVEEAFAHYKQCGPGWD